MKISVIICTHNPRRDYLHMTLEGLKYQTLPVTDWELLLIDNDSDQALSGDVDISWHPQGRHVREEELGLTPARLRGIKESNADLLVFVDDDNVLDTDYLEEAFKIAGKHPFVGVYGGSSQGRYEKQPPEWAEIMLSDLAIRDVTEDSWACLPGTKALVCAPCGAGMVIRKAIAEHYAELLEKDSMRTAMDRKGSSLSSAGDSDMALTACKIGYAIGTFAGLSLAHLIPEQRLERDYLLRLAEGQSFSYVILTYLHTEELPAFISNRPECGRAEALLKAYQSLRARLKSSNKNDFREDVSMARLKGAQNAASFLAEKFQ
jgi:glycosyltransferase involved in cell wall biosynthesis